MNLFKRLKALLPDPPLLSGVITAVDGSLKTVTLNGGGQEIVRGEGNVGDRVFFRDGAVEGPAPSLPEDLIEV